MTLPIATYRLQLRNGFTFADAIGIVPYLAKLGISHVYLSPIFRSAPASAHGYDALDFNEIETSLGGRAGFEALIEELNRFDLKVIVDFVPNHMAAHPENPWWRDVLEWGQRSRYADHFDIDWSVPKLLVPILGGQYGDVLSAGELKIGLDAERGELVARYFDNALPLSPTTYEGVFASNADVDLARLREVAASCSPENADRLKQSLKLIISSKPDTVEKALRSLNERPSEIHSILERQVWRLAYWRTAREMLTYRRFFEISDLVGVRVERSEVFADVHRTVLELVGAGKIDGLRIDHVDGLADPKGYLEQLRCATSTTPDLYLVVEKILGAGEDAREDWPMDGTTGYEFIRDISGLFIADDLARLSRGYGKFTSTIHDYAAETIAIKRRTLTFNLAAELRALVANATAIAGADIATRDFGPDVLRNAIIEIAVHFATYRTYINRESISEIDLNVIKDVSHRAKVSREVEDPAVVDFIVSIITGDISPALMKQADVFVTKFQQTTGPLMAKAVEDTEFYRFNRLIGLNEVGGEPDHLHRGVEAFHTAMRRRQTLAPRALSATATHDTKRGEDARVRLYGISSIQEDWCSAVERWRGLLRPLTNAPGAEELDSEAQWLFFQSLAGAWPLDEVDKLPKEFVDRIEQFMIKAAREAKLRTSWTKPHASYERVVSTFVRAALEGENAFLEDFKRTIAPLVAAGAAASLVQTVLKVFAPGIPDVYQGTEQWDLSLVDPDNRRPIDFERRERMREHSSGIWSYSQDDWRNGGIKLDILRKSLALRRSMDFTSAEYEALRLEDYESCSCFAFMRRSEGALAIVIGAIPNAAIYQRGGFGFNGASLSNAIVMLPRDVEHLSFIDVLSGKHLIVDDRRIKAAEVLLSQPIAVLLPVGLKHQSSVRGIGAGGN